MLFLNRFNQASITLCVLFVVTSKPETARSGGLFFPDLGSKALGRGSAFVARADNLSAFYFNPAGLSKQKGPSVLLGSNFIDLNSSFLRSGSGEWIPIEVEGFPDLDIGYGNPDLDYSEGVENAKPFRAVSQQTAVAVTGFQLTANWGEPFGLTGLAVGAGIFAPSSHNDPAYPADGPQRYAIRAMHTVILYPGLSVSYAINRYLQLGAVFLNGMAWIAKSQASRLSPTPGDIDFNEDAMGDASVRLTLQDRSMPTGIFGLLSHPLDWLELGAAARLPVQMRAKGKVAFNPPQTDYPSAELITGANKAEVKQRFPWIWSAGLRYIHQRFDLEIDIVWETWSSYEGMEVDLDARIDLQPDPTNIEPVSVKEMPDTVIPKHFRDAYSVRIGSDIVVWPNNLTARVGFYHQSSAYPLDNSTFSLDFPFGEQFGLSTGLTWHAFGFLELNVGYLHIFQKEVVVENGVLQQSGSPVELGEGVDPIFIGNVVNNGSYNVDLNIFSVSIEGHFGRIIR